ncbi:endo-beta-N-acetylglucosaminidase [Enterococcus faecium]|uniref:endo-beta-N-acetylglucosaminidase n=1 Tax=Enterococcus TaxID=1350 RepID=UPI00223A7B4A|nr:hypothetical protein [Enterococcus faecium]MCS8593381.1 hypothetical protein [Enterococcus faecium]
MFLAKDEDGKFSIVEKMIEVTNTYGFDDWFINQETDTAVTSFDDAAVGIEQSRTDGKGLNESHAKAM